VLPAVLTTRLPSLPSKLLPDRFANPGLTTASASTAVRPMVRPSVGVGHAAVSAVS
jgi:hypothetical protein